MNEHEFSFPRFLFALLVLSLSIAFFLAPPAVGIANVLGFWFEDTQSMMIVAGVAIVNAFFLIRAFRTPNYYCSDCGQYLGHKPDTCPRCECNIYQKGTSGVGQTYRDGGKNY